MIPTIISLVKIFLMFVISPADFLKYSLSISNTTPKIIANMPLEIKKENGKKETAQISSIKPKAKTAENIKICFFLRSPRNSPENRSDKKSRQNVKKNKKPAISNPLKKLITWYKIRYKIKLKTKKIQIGETISVI